jgi:hypothetical protein
LSLTIRINRGTWGGTSSGEANRSPEDQFWNTDRWPEFKGPGAGKPVALPESKSIVNVGEEVAMTKWLVGSGMCFALLFFAGRTPAQTSSRVALEGRIAELTKQLKEAEQQFFAPSPEDLDKYKSFLSEVDTGLVRLLPREKFQDKLFIRGGGAYYSFDRLTHEYGWGSDIELAQQMFSVGFAGADYGLVTDLGRIPIEQITPEHPAVRYLLSYKPPTREPDVRAEYQRVGAGFSVDDVSYGRNATVRNGATYLLRSIVIDRSDLLVVFRVVGRDSDGSVSILWKVLERFPAPRMIRETKLPG